MNIDKELSSVREILENNWISEFPMSGKMIRVKLGILMLKSFRLEIKTEDIMYLSAIELIHNASLLHDDILDNEKFRRGEQTLREKFNNKYSLLNGNLMLIGAIKILNEIGSASLIDIALSAIDDMCKGEIQQQTQLETIPKLENYIEKSKLKTASLFIATAKGLRELSNNILPECYIDFEENYGIAFQIKNDYDNVITSNSDRLNGIFTAPYIFSKGENVTKQELEKTLSLIDNYSCRAVDALSYIEENIYKRELIGVVECLKN